MFQSDIVPLRNVRRIAATVFAMIALWGMESLAVQEVASNAEIKKGGTVVVSADRAELMLGSKTLASFDKGTKLKVVQVMNEWIGAEVRINGKTVEGWIRRTKLTPVAPETDAAEGASSPALPTDKSDSKSTTPTEVKPDQPIDQPPPKEAATDEGKPAESLAEKFDRLMAEQEKTAAPGASAGAVPKEAPEEAVQPSVDAAPQEPGKEPDVATTEHPPKDDAAAPDVKPADIQPAETQPAETQPAETQPAETQPAETQPAETQPAETQPAETQPAETQTAETQPTEQPAGKAEQAPVTPAAEPDAVAAAPPMAEKATPLDTKPSEEQPEREATETPAIAESESPPPGEGEQSGGADVGEGPDAMAEKFAKILAERKNKTVVEVTEEASQEPEQPKAVAQQPPSEPVQDAAPAVAPQEQPFTIDVLVLRNPDDLADVESSERIGQLILSGDQFTNRTLQNLDGLNVSTLSIDAVNVTNAGIQYVQKVSGIRWLRLWSPAIDDRGLKLVGQLEGLKILDLEGTAVEGTGLEDLKGLQNLEQLILGPKMLDSEIARLELLPGLRQLDLRASKGLTLDCLEALGNLANLEVVWLPDQIRTKGKRALRAALPDCQVW